VKPEWIEPTLVEEGNEEISYMEDMDGAFSATSVKSGI